MHAELVEWAVCAEERFEEGCRDGVAEVRRCGVGELLGNGRVREACDAVVAEKAPREQDTVGSRGQGRYKVRKRIAVQVDVGKLIHITDDGPVGGLAFGVFPRGTQGLPLRALTGFDNLGCVLDYICLVERIEDVCCAIFAVIGINQEIRDSCALHVGDPFEKEWPFVANGGDAEDAH